MASPAASRTLAAASGSTAGALVMTEAEAGAGTCAGSNASAALGEQMGQVCWRMSALEGQVGSRMSALEEQMASQFGARMSALEGQVSSQVGVVASRMTALEEQIAALTRMLHSTRTHN